MLGKRIKETDQGIIGEFNVTIYDAMQRRLRDKGWIETNALLKLGLREGHALEIGSGPGYLGLEWVSKTKGTALKGLDVSQDMIKQAYRNAKEYNILDRVEYIQGNSSNIPFADCTFNAVFSNGSLHEWVDPVSTFKEIWKVLKQGGRIVITDLRRDMLPPIRWFLYLNSKPKDIRPGLLTSIKAAYTRKELRELTESTELENCSITSNPIGLTLFGLKC